MSEILEASLNDVWKIGTETGPESQQSFLRDMIRTDGHGAKVWTAMARSFADKGEFSRAEALLTVVTAEYPGYYEATELFINIAFSQRRHEEALARAIHGIAQFPDQHYLRFSLLGALTQLRRHDEADQAMQQAVRDFPNRADLARELACLPSNTGNVHEPVQRLRSVIQKFPNDGPSFASMVEVLRMAGELSEGEIFIKENKHRFESDYAFLSAKRMERNAPGALV